MGRDRAHIPRDPRQRPRVGWDVAETTMEPPPRRYRRAFRGLTASRRCAGGWRAPARFPIGPTTPSGRARGGARSRPAIDGRAGHRPWSPYGLPGRTDRPASARAERVSGRERPIRAAANRVRTRTAADPRVLEHPDLQVCRGEPFGDARRAIVRAAVALITPAAAECGHTTMAGCRPGRSCPGLSPPSDAMPRADGRGIVQELPGGPCSRPTPPH
jgi:hypothetical protein